MTGSSNVIVVDSTVVVVPCTVRLPEITTLSVEPLPRLIEEPLTFKSPVTVKSFPMVTSFGKPTCNVTSVPDLVTAVLTSFVVPIIFRSSVSRSTSSVATPSESIVRAVATAT